MSLPRSLYSNRPKLFQHLAWYCPWCRAYEIHEGSCPHCGSETSPHWGRGAEWLGSEGISRIDKWLEDVGPEHDEYGQERRVVQRPVVSGSRVSSRGSRESREGLLYIVRASSPKAIVFTEFVSCEKAISSYICIMTKLCFGTLGRPMRHASQPALTQLKANLFAF